MTEPGSEMGGEQLSPEETLLLGIGSLTEHDTEGVPSLLATVNSRIRDIMYGFQGGGENGEIQLDDAQRYTVLYLLQGEVTDRIVDELKTTTPGSEPPSMSTFRRLDETKKVIEVRMGLNGEGAKLDAARATATKLHKIRKERAVRPPTPPVSGPAGPA
jgi:hypothetical protein